MNLQVIISGDRWVLDRHGKLLADAFDKMEGNTAVALVHPVAGWADITYLMNYAQVRKLNCSMVENGGIVSMMTHFDPDMKHLWDRACGISKSVVPMSEATAKDVGPMGDWKATVIPLPVPDYITKRRPRIGIAGIRNAANEHRKGWDLVDRLRVDHPEWDIVTTGGALTEPEMLAWYRSLDLYLCPSRYEGGPMGVIEAAAMGVPLVTPQGVGWCENHAGWHYPSGEMEKYIRDAVRAWRDNWRLISNPFTEADYIEAHRKLFDSLV